MLNSSANSSLDSLFDLACRDGVDIRPTLLRVLTDLYVQKPAHSAAEETQYIELTLGLIEAVDGPTRDAIAASLSAYPAAPKAVLARLIGGPAPARTEAKTEIKTGTKTEIEPRAKNDLVELFFAANSEERRLILTNLDASVDAAAGTLARRPPAASSEVIRRLENAALQRNSGEFSRMLERALGIARELAERITRDPSGEPIVVAARALGMGAEVLQRVLLFLNPAVGQSVERVYDLSRLYDDLTPATAERMMAIWRDPDAQTQPNPRYAPLHWNDERRDARALSTPARYRSDRRRVEQPTRVKTSDQR